MAGDGALILAAAIVVTVLIILLAAGGRAPGRRGGDGFDTGSGAETTLELRNLKPSSQKDCTEAGFIAALAATNSFVELVDDTVGGLLAARGVPAGGDPFAAALTAYWAAVNTLRTTAERDVSPATLDPAMQGVLSTLATISRTEPSYAGAEALAAAGAAFVKSAQAQALQLSKVLRNMWSGMMAMSCYD